MTATQRCQVVVVGAGLSGLRCADRLRSSGLKVRVIEARDRVGGRTLSRRIGTGTFDLGGQWLGPSQDRVAALARELDVHTFPTFHHGRRVLDHEGRLSTYDGTIPKMAPWVLLDVDQALRRMSRRLKDVDVDQPLRTPDGAALDGQSLETWARSTMFTSSARAVFASAMRIVFGFETSDISALHTLFYARAAGGLMPLFDIENGAQQDRFVEGAQSLSLRLADRLEGPVCLDSPVTSIEHRASGVTVRSTHHTFEADAVVLALPPALCGRISFSPMLPSARESLHQRFAMGATVKCMAFYERPFWRERGYSGEVVCTDGPVSVIFDNTSQDGGTACLLSFVVGNDARRWSSRSIDERRALILAQSARAFGPDSLKPVDYVEHDWCTEPFSVGCPTGALGPGGWSAVGDALRSNIGRIFFAGTETATVWTGFLEGALQAGDRAAEEVRAALA